MPITSVNARCREGAVLALVAVWLLVVGVPGTAAGSELERPEPDEVTTVEVTKSAYWTTPAPRTAPETLREEFPPGVVCIVVPQFCGEEARTVTEPVEEGLVGVQDEAEPEPVQPVADGTLPVGVLFGEQRYAAALAFEAPAVPDGERPSVVELVLEVATEPTGVESPVFQAAVDAAVGQIADVQADEDPSHEPFLEVLADTAEGETEPVRELEPPEIIVCGIVEDWEEGENQDAAGLPGTDHCILGGDGRPLDDGDEAWAFDITAAITAWLEDDPGFREENRGVMVLPGPTTPLAYGDPDSTTNFLGAFAEPDQVELRLATVEAVDGGVAAGGVAADGLAQDDVADEDVAADGGVDGGFDDDVAGPADVDATEAPPAEEAASGEPAVAEAAEPEVEQPAAGTGEGDAVDAAEPETPWYVWLLLPLAVGGAWWYSRLHEVAVPEELDALDGEGGGAMSRLVERARGG